MANTLILSGSGFVFWALAARNYDAESVGIAAALISAAGLINTLSTLGFDSLFIKFLPKANKAERHRQINTGLTISAISATLVSVAYFIIVKNGIAEFAFIYASAVWFLIFLAFMVINTLNNLTNVVFIAYRVSHLIFIVNFVFAVLRVVGVIVLAELGRDGLLLSHIIGTCVGLALTFYIFQRKLSYLARPQIVARELRASVRYASASYLYTVFFALPTLILPTIIIHALGTKESAYFYMVSVLIAALLIIPQAISQSLFAESSWDESKLLSNIMRVSKTIFAIMIPAIILLCVLGSYLLGFFGDDYKKYGYGLLVILAISAVPRTINTILSVMMRLQHQVHTLAALYGLYAAIIIGGSFLLLNNYSLIFVGYITLFAESLVCIIGLISAFSRMRREPSSKA